MRPQEQLVRCAGSSAAEQTRHVVVDVHARLPDKRKRDVVRLDGDAGDAQVQGAGDDDRGADVDPPGAREPALDECFSRRSAEVVPLDDGIAARARGDPLERRVERVVLGCAQLDVRRDVAQRERADVRQRRRAVPDEVARRAVEACDDVGEVGPRGCTVEPAAERGGNRQRSAEHRRRGDDPARREQ